MTPNSVELPPFYTDGGEYIVLSSPSMEDDNQVIMEDEIENDFNVSIDDDYEVIPEYFGFVKDTQNRVISPSFLEEFDLPTEIEIKREIDE
jgi:hypothetical protein